MKVCCNLRSGCAVFKLQTAAMVFAEQFTDVETKTEVLGMAGSHVLRMVRSRRGSRALCEKGLNGGTAMAGRNCRKEIRRSSLLSRGSRD